MNHGVIEQVGTPQEIYQQPATRFVAEFVGSMNFIETSVATDSQVRIAETLMSAPSLTNRKIQRGDRFDLAVRPESIKFVENYTNSLPVRVTATEFLGRFSALIAYCKTTAQRKPSSWMFLWKRFKNSISRRAMYVTSSLLKKGCMVTPCPRLIKR